MLISNNEKKINLINIFIFVLLTISVILLVYTHYKSYYIFNSNRLNLYIIYYIFSISGILFFLFLLFLKNIEVKKNIILLIFTLFFLLYLSELFVRIFFKKIDSIESNKIIRENKAKIVLEKYNQKIDTRSPIEVQRDLKKKGIDVALLVTPYRMLPTDGIRYFENEDNNSADNTDKIYPLSGISNTLYVGGSESGEYKFYKTDRYGFNNLDDDWDRDVHMVLIGDSFVHGGFLDFEDNFTGALKRLSGKSIISLGQPNNGPLLELATLKEYGIKVNPKIVLWMYYEGNDLIEVIDENKKSKILAKYLSGDFEQNLIVKQDIIEKSYAKFVSERIEKLDLNKNIKQVEAFSIDNRKNNKILSIVKLQRTREVLFTNIMNKFRDNENKKSVLYLKRILSEANKDVNSIDAEFYFVYLPSSTRFLDDYNYGLKKNKYFREEVISAVKELNIKIVDVYDVLFKNHLDPLSYFHFKMHSHYNKKAIEQISLEIYKQININNN